MFPSPQERDEVFDLVFNIWENCTKLAFDTQTSGRLLLPEKKSKPKDVNTDLPTEEDWNLLLKRADLLKFSKNDVILHEGDSSQRIYQIVKGTVRIEKLIFRRASAIEEESEPHDEGNPLNLFVPSFFFFHSNFFFFFFLAKIRSLFDQFDSSKQGTINLFEVKKRKISFFIF